MSPYRVADAARISPYPNTIRAQEHEASTSSGSHSSPSKARLIAAEAAAANSSSRSMRGVDRSFSNAERQVQKEGARFNIGPKKVGNFTKLKRGVRNRMGRTPWDSIDEGVPDYPPPSFQEATGGSVAPSDTPTQSSSPASLEAPTHQFSDHQTDLSESEQSIQQKTFLTSPSASDSDEDSLEFIENIRPTTLSTDQARTTEANQGIKFPISSLASTSMTAANTSVSSPSEPGRSRGRHKAKWSSKLDLTAENSEEEPQISPVRSTTKRFLSLSPLRTLFPAKHPVPHQRALSAHPTPGTSPYSVPANTTSFRSTTSLMTSSVPRLPFGNSTLTLTTSKPENVKSPSKRLFQGKAKEKEREREKERGKGKMKKERELDEGSDESLDSWEMLERELEKEDERRIEKEPRSLLAVIMPSAEIPSPTISPQSSPTRSVSFSCGPSTPTTLSCNPSTQESTEPPTPSWNEPHPLSLRDKKVAEAIEPFLRRQPKKAGQHRTKTTPNPIVIPSSPRGPLVTTVRSRLNPVHNLNDQPVADTSGHDGWEEWSNTTATISDSEIGSVAGKSTHDLRRALETPLPSSPIQMTQSPPSATNTPERRPSPPSMMISVSSPTTPVAVRGAPFHDGRRGGYIQPSPDQTPKTGETFNSSSRTPQTKITSHPSHYSFIPPSPSVSNSGIIMPPSPQNGRHHYVGRPLPRPPQPLRHAAVDSIYAGNDSYASCSPDHSYASIPEGLLIDLENEVEADPSGSWTPEELQPSSVLMTSGRPSPITSPRNTPEQSIRSMNTTGNISSLSSLSEMSDLDLLAVALTDGSGRTDYEDILMKRDPGSPTWARLPPLMSPMCHSPVVWRLNEGGSHRMGVSS